MRMLYRMLYIIVIGIGFLLSAVTYLPIVFPEAVIGLFIGGIILIVMSPICAAVEHYLGNQVVCKKCDWESKRHLFNVDGGSVKAAREAIREDGWISVNNDDFCPDCKHKGE